MAVFRLSSETIGEGIRVILFVLAVTAILFGIWPALGGSIGVYAMAAESTTVQKEAGVTTAEWTTQEAPSLSWIHVHVDANFEVDVRIVAANHRSIVVHNSSGFAAQEDLSVVAGGGSTGPRDGIGVSVDLGGSRGGPTQYIISVRASDASRAAGHTDRDIEYTLTWEVQKLDPTVFLAGLVLFAMFFVTEYMLHIRADMRTLARRVDRLVTEGVGGARGPSAALGAPAPQPPYGFGETEATEPRGRPAAASAAPAAAAPEERREGRRRLWGRSAAGQEVPPATEEEAVEPPPAVSDPYAPPSYAAAAPPAPAEEVEQPDYYEPPPPPPPPRRASVPAPPVAKQAPAPPRPSAAPAPPRPAAAAPAAEPVTRVRCPQCKHIVPVYTAQRPTPIKCPNCGKKGMLTR